MLQVYGAIPFDAEQVTDTMVCTTSGSVVGVQLTGSNCPDAAPAVNAASAIKPAVVRLIWVDQSPGYPG